MRTRPRESARVPEEVQRALEGSGPFLITGHLNPDGDSLGTALALAAWLRGRGEPAHVVSVGGVPGSYGFLPGAHSVTSEFPPDHGDPVAVIVDSPTLVRVGAPDRYFDRARLVVNIDHHPDNTGFGDAAFVDPTASSAALLAFEIMRGAGAAFTREIAGLLYVGILTDTGGFRFANTDARTLRAAAELVAHGARSAELASEVFGALASGELRLLGLVLSSVESIAGGRVTLLSLTDRMRGDARATGDGIEGLASFGCLVRGSEVAVLLREDGRSVRASLRSNGGVDVGGIARSLGGGGHGGASGVLLDGPLSEARTRILSAIEKQLG